jgi:hypothetical protein
MILESVQYIYTNSHPWTVSWVVSIKIRFSKTISVSFLVITFYISYVYSWWVLKILYLWNVTLCRLDSNSWSFRRTILPSFYGREYTFFDRLTLEGTTLRRPMISVCLIPKKRKMYSFEKSVIICQSKSRKIPE